jgi:hypothetical protein
MPSSGVRRRVDLVGTYVSEELIASIFRVKKSARGCRRYVQPKRRLTRSTLRYNPEDGILHYYKRFLDYLCTDVIYLLMILRVDHE